MNGFVIIDKEAGMTSFFAASRLKRIYSQKKVGHTGTLDPMATGVLPVALGKATRFIDYLPDSKKGYIATFRLGRTTDTLDITGTVTSENEVNVSFDDVQKTALLFIGESQQLPPMYSAVSVNGVRLYSLARQGIEVERNTKTIFVDSISLSPAENNEYTLEVVCSKGTYIRSIISDIGEKLGCGAVMTSLRRNLACGYSLENAHTLDEIRENPFSCILPLDFALDCYPAVHISEAQSKRFRNGGDLFCARIRDFEPAAGLYRVYSSEGEFLGLGRVKEESTESLYAEKVIGND